MSWKILLVWIVVVGIITSRNLEIIQFCGSNRDQVTMTSPFMDAYSKR
jgi:malate synthase